MTKQELDALVPNQSMVYAIRDGAEYTLIGKTEEGYLLCGKPFPLDEHIMLTCFETSANMARVSRIVNRL